MRRLAPFALIASVFVMFAVAPAQEKSVRPDINKQFQKPDVKNFLKKFEGESREVFAHREDIVKKVGVKPGMAVADVGAGTGLFSRLLAKEAGKTGKLIAVDISKEFLDHVLKTSKEAGLENVSSVKCSQTSSELPKNSVDLVFVCDTYHHFEFPFKTMASIHQALKPGGQLVVIDFERIPGKTSEWILGHVRAGKETVIDEIRTVGFERIEEIDVGLKENYFLRFRKVEPKKRATK